MNTVKDEVEAEGVTLTVIIPAFNEEKIIASVISQTKSVLEAEDISYELLIINDGSKDNTLEVAEEVGATVISHPYNIGNGAAIKTGIRNASGEYLVMMDGDGQHDPGDIPLLVSDLGKFDMSVGARTAASETSAHRDFANMIFNLLASYVVNRRIEDLTSGFRAMRTALARQFVYLLPNSYSYPTTLTLSALGVGYSINYRPIQVKKRVGNSNIRIAYDGMRFLMIILKIAVLFSPLRIFLPISAVLFLAGLSWYIIAVFFLSKAFPPTSMILMMTSVIVFCFGLLSEQINQIRNDRSS